MSGIEGLKFKTEVYEGPLDLLLALISKNKVDICDIPISLILDQYLEYLDIMKSMDMEIASEFIIMASELMLIKSKMLLPRQNEAEEDPREALAAALLEYKKAKEAVPVLNKRFKQYSGRMVKDVMELAPERTILLGLDVSLLEEAFERILRHIKLNQSSPAKTFTPLISRRVVPVQEKIMDIISLISKCGEMSLREIIMTSKTKSEAIASFLALLELIKSRTVFLRQTCDENYIFELDKSYEDPNQIFSDTLNGLPNLKERLV